MAPGSRLPAYASATGRVLLAAVPPNKARSRVAGWRSCRSRRAALPAPRRCPQVEACRDRGYAVCGGEPELAFRSMGVSVIDRGGHTAAALGIAVRADRWSLSGLVAGFLPALRRAQYRLARQLPDE